MASLTKLRRRALRWQRYENRAYGPCLGVVHRGYERALFRVWDEEERRDRLGWGWDPWDDYFRPVDTAEVAGGVL